MRYEACSDNHSLGNCLSDGFFSFIFLFFLLGWFVAWHTFGVGAILECLLRTTSALQQEVSLRLNLPKKIHSMCMIIQMI